MTAKAALKPDPDVRVRDFPIGCIGAGMIMAECHLATPGFENPCATNRKASRYG